MKRSVITPVAVGGLLAALFGGPTYAFAAAAQQDPEPPSIVQLCAATSIEEVDALLDGVATSGLAGQLAPLVGLVVPGNADTIELQGSVTLDDVRDRLDCDPATADPEPTDTPDPTTDAPAPTTETPAPTTPSTKTPTGDGGSFTGGGFSQLDSVPSLPAETGGGPAA